MQEKKCTKCKILKLISEFHRNITSKDGYSNTCKKCTFIYKEKVRNKKNHDIINEKKCGKCKKIKSISKFVKCKNTISGYSNSCKECIRYKRLKTNYGINRRDYITMLELQNNVCAICKKKKLK